LKENTLMAAGIIVAIMFGICVACSAELWGRGAFGSIEKMVGRARTSDTDRSNPMVRSALAVAAASIAASVSFSPPVLAQDETDQRFGTVHFETSCNEVAQRRFDRAMRY
jgi:hypothetical protein